MRTGSLLSDAWKAWAAPAKLPCTLCGRPRSCIAALIATTASPSATPGARLNDSVTDGNWPWWFTARLVGVGSKWVKALSGTCVPSAERMNRSRRISGCCQYWGATSITKWYWLSGV